MKIGIIMLLSTFIQYLLIVTVVDALLMGVLHVRLSRKCRQKAFLITKANRIDLQKGYECSAYASAYLLRHLGIDADGDRLYEIIPNKLSSGRVYPKGILRILARHGVKARYCAGNLAALKKEVSKGSPVIVMIRVRPDRSWLHFVPVVGYDEQHLFLAESMADFVNCSEPFYNRKISTKAFQKLWNTSMFSMPCYRNTYISLK